MAVHNLPHQATPFVGRLTEIAEIASRLVFAASTAKQHLKNIYGKLNVHNRTQAVSRGRELGLL